jgi:hypothetical protein
MRSMVAAIVSPLIILALAADPVTIASVHSLCSRGDHRCESQLPGVDCCWLMSRGEPTAGVVRPFVVEAPLPATIATRGSLEGGRLEGRPIVPPTMHRVIDRVMLFRALLI